jgi:hypothetical protein
MNSSKVFTYSLLFGLLSTAALADPSTSGHKLNLPFLGQPAEKQSHMTEDGLTTFRLRRATAPSGTSRNIKEVTDDDFSIDYSLKERIQDFLLGKSEERVLWENFEAEMKQRAKAKKSGKILQTTTYDIVDNSANT